MESASDKETHAEIVIPLSEDLSAVILTMYTRDIHVYLMNILSSMIYTLHRNILLCTIVDIQDSKWTTLILLSHKLT